MRNQVEKVKTFIKKHKKEVIGVAGAVVGGVACAYVLNHKKVDKKFAEFFMKRAFSENVYKIWLNPDPKFGGKFPKEDMIEDIMQYSTRHVPNDQPIWHLWMSDKNVMNLTAVQQKITEELDKLETQGGE